MPELPEVETLVRQLSPVLLEQKLRKLDIFDERLEGIEKNRLLGSRIRKVSRLGKQVVLSLQSKGARKADLFVAVHLRMSGRLVWAAGKPAREKSRHLRANFLCESGELHFIDTRRFGTIDLAAEISQFEPRGLDPLSEGFNAKKLASLIGSSSQALKEWLLRQDRLVGIGNIYASEILFAAGLHPHREAGSLSSPELRKLTLCTKKILNRAIENCGTTFSDFVDSRGELGAYQRFLKVYKREGAPCLKCRSEIIREKSQGRSTFYCPQCQH